VLVYYHGNIVHDSSRGDQILIGDLTVTTIDKEITLIWVRLLTFVFRGKRLSLIQFILRNVDGLIQKCFF